MKRPRVSPRKVLAASIGVASISYVIACTRTQEPKPGDAPDAARAGAVVEDGSGGGVVSGNLVAPMPDDSLERNPPRARDAGAGKQGCAPPYIIDNQGRKRFKPECL